MCARNRRIDKAAVNGWKKSLLPCVRFPGVDPAQGVSGVVSFGVAIAGPVFAGRPGAFSEKIRSPATRRPDVFFPAAAPIVPEGAEAGFVRSNEEKAGRVRRRRNPSFVSGPIKNACSGQLYPDPVTYLCGMDRTADRQYGRSCGMPFRIDAAECPETIAGVGWRPVMPGCGRIVYARYPVALPEKSPELLSVRMISRLKNKNPRSICWNYPKSLR